MITILLDAKGPKKGQGALFNECMASYEHDWDDAVFEEQYYERGCLGLAHPCPSKEHDDDIDF